MKALSDAEKIGATFEAFENILDNCIKIAKLMSLNEEEGKRHLELSEKYTQLYDDLLVRVSEEVLEEDLQTVSARIKNKVMTSLLKSEDQKLQLLALDLIDPGQKN